MNYMKKDKDDMKECMENFKNMKGSKCNHGSKSPSCLYFLGFAGAAIFFIQQATSFGAGVIGILKAAVWPAFLIHSLLKFLGM